MKLYNLYLHSEPIHSLLTAPKVLAAMDHKTIRDWLKVAKINEAQIVLTQQYQQGELWLKRIQ